MTSSWFYSSVITLKHGPININFFLEARHPRCVCSNNKNLCIILSVEHNYILPSSTVGIQLHVSALCVWAIFRLRFNLQGCYTRFVGCFWGYWGLGGGGEGERDLVVSIVRTMTWGCYKWIIISCLCTHVKVGYYFYAKDMLQLVA